MPMVKAINPANPADLLMAVNGGKRRTAMAQKKKKAVKKTSTHQSRSHHAQPKKHNPAKRHTRRARRRNPSEDLLGFVTAAGKVGAGVLISETANGFLPASQGILMDLLKQGLIGYGTYWGLKKLRFMDQTANLVAAGTVVPLVVNIVRPFFNRITSTVLPAPAAAAAPVNVAPNAQPQAVRGASGIALMPPRARAGMNGIALMPPMRQSY